jgi:pimeloyl-ACP methyl ester carboxylesterase
MRKLSFLAILLITGCTTWLPANSTPRSPEVLPERVSTAADVSGENPVFSISVDQDLEPNETQWTVTSKTGDALNFKYLRSEISPDEKHDLVFLYNILKDKHQIVSGLLADALLEKGFDCVIVQQEFFLSHRWTRPVRSDWPEPNSPHKSYDQYNTYLAQSIGRIINYWLPNRASLSGRYGFVGVSLGGIHAIAAAAIFPDSVMTVAIMAGGGNVDLFKHSQESLVIDNREKLFDKYALTFAEENPDVRFDWERALYDDIAGLKFRILEMARCIDTKKIKLMITLDDTSVPTKCQWNLYHALGGPEARLFPCGHYSMALYYFAVKDQLQKWMCEAFK